MTSYHINDRGEPGPCRAKKACPFGGSEDHYTTLEEARTAYELVGSSREVLRSVAHWTRVVPLAEKQFLALQECRRKVADSSLKSKTLVALEKEMEDLLRLHTKLSKDLSIPRSFQEHIKRKYEGVDLLLRDDGDGYVTLQRIVVSNQKQGIGSRVMEELVAHADANNWTVALTPSTTLGATSKARLEKFYRRFGFTPNRGTRKDYRTMESMIRRPSPPA